MRERHGRAAERNERSRENFGAHTWNSSLSNERSEAGFCQCPVASSTGVRPGSDRGQTGVKPGRLATCQRHIHQCRFIDVQDASALYRLLGDEARLRLLRLLALDRLNVTELTGILGLAQSGVSRHLGLLKDGGLVSEEREAGFTYYRISPDVRVASNGHTALWTLLLD